RAVSLPRHLPSSCRTVQSTRSSLDQFKAGGSILGVDRKLVKDVDALKAAVGAARAERREKVVLFIRRGLDTSFVAVSPPW
ncbi:MAG: hypothetical protein ACRDHY_16500, partial [Anaerolineales bacterium]